MTACLVSSEGSHDVEQIAWSPTKRKDPVSALASDPSGGRWDTLGMAGHGVRSGGIARTEIDAWTAAADRREEHSDVTHRVQTTVFDHADGYRRLSTRATTARRRPRPPMASCGSYRRPASVSSTRVVSRFSTTCGIPVSCDADERASELSRGASLALFRILQEALANAAKHARARRITVALARTDDVISLAVSDDGAGFDAGRLGTSGGLGLVMMRERASQLNGRFEFESAPGHGTIIRVVVPFR